MLKGICCSIILNNSDTKLMAASFEINASMSKAF